LVCAIRESCHPSRRAASDYYQSQSNNTNQQAGPFGGAAVKKSLLGGMLCCILSVSTLAFGQSATTSLRGVVKDSSGALVQGATITLKDQANDNSYHARSDAAGFYIFPIISPAHYLITISSGGFAVQTRTAELLVDQPATINFTLSVQASTVTVDVSSAAETLNFTDATIGNSVGNPTIQALPMEGRDPINLLSLQPGVLYVGNEISDSRQGAVAGGRSDQGNITLDGLDDNDQIGGAAFTGILRSTLDSTEEFRVTTSNGTAASGRSSGAQVDLVTKSGTNKYHGAAYEYYRPTNTVANSYFYKNEEIGSDTPNIPQKYVLNTFGGSIGAPIFKDKLFYFFNYEGKRQAISDVVGATVPTTTFMGGGLEYQDTSGNTDTLTPAQVATLDMPCETQTFQGNPVCPNGPGANAALLSYLSTEPTATGTVLGDGGFNSGSYFFTSPAPSTLNTSIVKLDYNMNSKNHFFVRGNLQKDTASGDENLPGQPAASFYDDNTKGISAGHTWIPTSHIVNDLRYGYIRQGWQSGGIAPGEWVDIYGLTQPTAQTGSSLLHVPVQNVTDTLSWNKGTHTFAFGGNWRGITNHHSGNTNSFDGASTTYEYANTGDLPVPANMSGGFFNSWQMDYANSIGIVPLLFNVYDYTITGATTGVALPEGAPVTKNFHSNEMEGYVQDTWHARPNLTVTYGVRYTLLQTPYETNGQQIAPNIDTDAWYQKRESAALQGQIYEPIISLAPSGKANHAAGYWPQQKKDFAPRIGVVFAPDAKTSLRASAGMYYDHYGEALVNTFDADGSYGLTAGISNAADVLGFENSPRFTGPHNLPDIPLPPFSPTQSFPFTPPVNGFDIDWGIDSHVKTPYAESFNVSFQHELPGGFTFEEAYVGRLGHHLLQELDLAEPTDFVDPSGGGDYFSAARILSKEVDAAPKGVEQYGIFAGGTQKVNNNVPAIPYFENVFPYMKNQDYAGESATQAMFNNAWAPERYTNGETLALAIADVFGIFPGSPNYGPGSQGSTFWSSQFSSLYALSSIGNSSYNALQFTIRHPASHGLTVDFSYTFSKSLDLGSETERSNIFSNVDNGYTNFAIQNTWNPKLNKGVSDFDTHSLLTTDWVYSLPVGRGKAALGDISRAADAIVGGWQWAGLARWTSGLPFSIESPAYPTNYDNPAMTFNTGNVKTHRSIIDGIPHAIDPSVAAAIGNGIYFGNPIRLPYAGEAGNRNVYRGDGYFDIDSALSKTWGLGDWAKLKFAAEAYNITNSVRFDTSLNGLVGSSASPNLGTYDAPLSTYRRMQFGLRVDF
jgi:Carboxypeptidase regulatory-like domain/TonB dependent receptor